LISISLALFTSTNAQSPKYCPPLGPIYPPPTNLSNDPTFATAVQDITSILGQVTSSNGSLSNTSISVQIFDATESGPLLNFAYTADNINTTLGVSKVDQDTVFRVGSVSKLWTMVLFLIEEGLWPFQEPVARFIPELARAERELRWDPRKRRDGIDYVHWGHVSMGELASHLAGIARDCGFFLSVLFYMRVS
jgi:CubicO group peptidase (beta-lactamase class C family)